MVPLVPEPRPDPLPIEPLPIEPLPRNAPLPVIESVVPPTAAPASTPPVVPMREESLARLPDGARRGSFEFTVPAVPGTGAVISGPMPTGPAEELMLPGVVICAHAALDIASAATPATNSFFTICDSPIKVKKRVASLNCRSPDAIIVPLPI
jgi:hypothetical protein